MWIEKKTDKKAVLKEDACRRCGMMISKNTCRGLHVECVSLVYHAVSAALEVKASDAMPVLSPGHGKTNRQYLLTKLLWIINRVLNVVVRKTKSEFREFVV